METNEEMKRKLFILAGNYHEFKVLTSKLPDSYEPVYISSVSSILGYRDQDWTRAGTWFNRKDLEPIIDRIISADFNEVTLELIFNQPPNGRE